VAGGSVSELVIFIAAVSVAAGVSGVMVTTVGGISDSLDERGASVSAAIETDVEVISDPGSGAVYDDGTGEVTLLVKNTGERALPTDGSGVEVLVDGRYVPPADYDVTVVGGGEWRDGAVVRVTVDRSLAAGDHRATVVVRSDRETVRFRT
jgi:flagellar protein FlaG